MGGSQPQATRLSDRGHPLPRRSPSTRLSPPRKAGDGPSQRDVDDAKGGVPGSSGFLRRNSSDESHETGQSDPRVWFNRSNQNPAIDMTSMEVDSPYYQKDRASSKDGAPYDGVPPRNLYNRSTKHPSLRPTVTQSSSADEYRSVIDDLTIENNRLKEELKRYKQFGTDLMRKDRLFEIKVHGLPSKKKRELEATLRDFASTLASSDTSSRHKKPSKTGNRFKSSGGTTSKHASSSSSNSRPIDSAYASMSTNPSTTQNSSSNSMARQSLASRARSNAQKVESYLEDIPEGLYPRYLAMTEKEKQKLVVRRLEQLFTGEMKGPSLGSTDRGAGRQENVQDGTVPKISEASREAQIQFREKKQSSRDNRSSNSNGDGGSGSGGGGASGSRSGNGSGSGSRESPQGPQPASEQRPTRPLDLDPDRIQVPSENMEYIRHLGMVPPELQSGAKWSSRNVSMDADGWVYLNLLCNLAQLHIINVTPAFIRAAVSEKSTKFQLSPDGQKIRWRGGTDGTRFSSDSGNTSSRDRSSDGDDSSDKSGGVARKRKFGEERAVSTTASKLGNLASRSTASVHYKPMFVQQSSFDTSAEEGSSSQASAAEESNFAHTSKWGYSGSGSSPRKKRRVDGAIVYYTGVPFCIDLSGDVGDVSPSTYMTSTNQETKSSAIVTDSPKVFRTLSGSSLPYRPLSDEAAHAKVAHEVEQSPEEDVLADLMDDSSDSEDDFRWLPSEPTNTPDLKIQNMEACGLGGVQPEDHFVVLVVTQRFRDQDEGRHGKSRPYPFRKRSDSTTATIMERFKSLKASSPVPTRWKEAPNPTGMVTYVSQRMQRLDPAPLPAAALFVPPFSTSSSDIDEESVDSEILDSEEQDAVMSGPSLSPPERPGLNSADSNLAYPEGDELSPTDEEDEADSENADERDDELRLQVKRRKQWHPRPLVERAISQRSDSRKAVDARTQSSVATAGGAESGYNSSMEEDK